jgi:tRNA pseudouridine38-40 synthase
VADDRDSASVVRDDVGGMGIEQGLQDTGFRTARFLVSYAGGAFRGFAPNRDVRTVMGDLSEAIDRVLQMPIDLTGAGRTDAGVHAWGQVISGKIPSETDLDGLARRLNKLCGPDISVRSAEWAADEFSARFSATWRQYRFHIWNDPAPNPLLHPISWHVARALDIDAMNESMAALIGEHDFTAFCRRPKVGPDQRERSMIRILFEADWKMVESPQLIRFTIRGSAFCHQMVRSIVGTAVEVGLGRIDSGDVATILHERDRSLAGQVAPPEGLILWAVGYDGVRWDADPAPN